MEGKKKQYLILRRLRINQTMLPYKLFYFFSDGATSCIAPYRALYLKQLGLGPSRIGIVAAMKPVATFLSNAMIGFLADRFGCQKGFMLVSLLIWIGSFLALGFIPPASEVSDAVAKNQLAGLLLPPYNGSNFTNTVSARHTRSSQAQEQELHPIHRGPFHHRVHNRFRDIRCKIVNCKTSPFHLVPQNLRQGYEPIPTSTSRFEFTASTSATPPRTSQTKPPDGVDSNYVGQRELTLNETPSANEPLITRLDVADFSADRSWLYDQQELLRLFLIILVITNGIYMSLGSFMRLADTATLNALVKEEDGDMSDYGWHRSFGGLGWALCSLTVGVLLSGTSTTVVRWGISLVMTDYRVAFVAFATVAVFAMFCSCFMEYEYKRCDWGTQWIELKRVLCSGHFASVFFVALFTGICNGCVWSFLLWHFQNLGASQTLIGILEALQSISELVLGFFCRRFLKSIGYMAALTLGLGVYALRFVCYAAITNPWWLIPVEIVHGISFLLTWTTLVSYFGSAVPAECMTTVQGILGALYFGLGVGVGSLATGVLIDRFDAVRTFYGFAVASLVATFVFILCQQFFPPHELQTNEKEEPSDEIDPETEEIIITPSPLVPVPVRSYTQQVISSAPRREELTKMLPSTVVDFGDCSCPTKTKETLPDCCKSSTLSSQLLQVSVAPS